MLYASLPISVLTREVSEQSSLTCRLKEDPLRISSFASWIWVGTRLNLSFAVHKHPSEPSHSESTCVLRGVAESSTLRLRYPPNCLSMRPCTKNIHLPETCVHSANKPLLSCIAHYLLILRHLQFTPPVPLRPDIRFLAWPPTCLSHCGVFQFQEGRCQ